MKSQFVRIAGSVAVMAGIAALGLAHRIDALKAGQALSLS